MNNIINDLIYFKKEEKLIIYCNNFKYFILNLSKKTTLPIISNDKCNKENIHIQIYNKKNFFRKIIINLLIKNCSNNKQNFCLNNQNILNNLNEFDYLINQKILFKSDKRNLINLINDSIKFYKINNNKSKIFQILISLNDYLNYIFKEFVCYESHFLFKNNNNNNFNNNKSCINLKLKKFNNLFKHKGNIINKNYNSFINRNNIYFNNNNNSNFSDNSFNSNFNNNSIEISKNLNEKKNLFHPKILNFNNKYFNERKNNKSFDNTTINNINLNKIFLSYQKLIKNNEIENIKLKGFVKKEKPKKLVLNKENNFKLKNYININNDYYLLEKINPILKIQKEKEIRYENFIKKNKQRLIEKLNKKGIVYKNLSIN